MNHIVLVDDNFDDLYFMDVALTKAGFITHKYDDPRKALNDISSIKPNLFISDYYVGVMRGTEVLRLIKSAFPNLPCIIVSGLAANFSASDRINGLADAIIPKTPDFKELIHQVVHLSIDPKQPFPETVP